MDEDPSSSWWTNDPHLPVTPAQERRFAELAGENPILAHTRRTRDGRPHRISDFLSRDEYHRLRLYREFYGQIEAEYQVALSLPSRPPVVIGLALTRSQSDFSDVEVALLGAARPHLIQAYRNAELAAAREATIAALGAGLEDVGTAVIVVDRHGRSTWRLPPAGACSTSASAAPTTGSPRTPARSSPAAAPPAPR
jgi:hypothetical protein